jgi:hypothetical protein
MTTPLVVIRVELPAYCYSFNIEVPGTSTVLDVKQAISTACTGQPRPEGQRIIWRGRCLDDVEKISELWPVRSAVVLHWSLYTQATSPVVNGTTHRPFICTTFGMDGWTTKRLQWSRLSFSRPRAYLWAVTQSTGIFL